MATARTDAADNLMLTGAVLFCPDCADDATFVVPDCGDGQRDCGEYCCTGCGAAVTVLTERVVERVTVRARRSARVA
jgi:hypothetical protein